MPVSEKPIFRREFLIGLSAFAAACGSSTGDRPLVADIWSGPEDTENSGSGRLHSRPGKPTQKPLEPGEHQIDVAAGRKAIAYIPREFDQSKPVAFLLLLHGATLDAEGPIKGLKQFADDSTVVLLSPKSEDYTWDLSIAGFGDDAGFVDKCLDYMFDRCVIDKKHLAIGGFSDGASYALTLGTGNGDLFSQAIAFSPGYVAAITHVGKPRIFIAHGTRDTILPIDKCGRRIASDLRADGYDVTFKEFDGPHTVPPEIAKAAVTWFKA